MKKSYIFIVVLSLFIFTSEVHAQLFPATCNNLVTNIDMWGLPARGVDLRAYTNSTLHWIGCPTDGCDPDTFFCTYDPNTQTLSFGTNSINSALRAAVDPGNAQGNTMPNANLAPDGCCTAEVPLFGICNAPDSDNNGVPIDAAEALCFALGYETGTLTEVNSNSCPEANTTDAEGSNWTSDFVETQGFGQTYTCVGFRDVAPLEIPTLSKWGLIAMVGILGIIGFIAIKRRKATA